MMSSQNAPILIALAAAVLLWRIVGRFRRAVGRQRFRALRARITATVLPVVMVSLLFGVWAQPWNALAQLGGIALGAAAAQYSMRTLTLEVVDGIHYVTPNPFIGTAIVAIFVVRVLYKLWSLYTATGGFHTSPLALVRNPVTAFIAGLMLGFYAWQAWRLLQWRKATQPSAATKPSA